mgnify:CR=1 FL=1
MFKKTNKYKPIYKKFLRLKENVQNKNIQKFINFKRNKWRFFIKNLLKFNYRKKKYFNDFFFLPKFGVYRVYDNNKFVVQIYSGISKKKKYRFHMIQKQLFKHFYGGLSANYLKRLVKTTTKSSLKNSFISRMESRLDVILYRSHFSVSIRNARQLILHGHIYINDKIITSYSYFLRKSDRIRVKFTSRKHIQRNIKYSNYWPLPLSYLTINYRTLEIHYSNSTEDYAISIYYPFWLNSNNFINTHK